MSPKTHGSSPRKERLIGLDLLRLAAIVLVLGRHLPDPPSDWPDWARSGILTWIRGGWIGVDLFFVLSGFLVSGLLFAEHKTTGKLGIGRFYMRRAWKIYPPFFAMIFATMALGMTRGTPMPTSSIVSEMLFLQSYIKGLWLHTWSLAVEEHFYLLIPLVLAVLTKMNRTSPTPLRPLVWIIPVIGLASLGIRMLTWHLIPSFGLFTHMFQSHLRFDSLAFGVAISYAYHFHHDWFTHSLEPFHRGFFWIGILLLTPAFIFPVESTPWMTTVGFTLFYLASGLLLTGTLLSKLPTQGLLNFLATIGAYSYSIYLWHAAVLIWGVPICEKFLKMAGLGLTYGLVMAIYFGGSIGFGMVMAKVIENPSLKLRDLLFPSRGPNALETGMTSKRS